MQKELNKAIQNLTKLIEKSQDKKLLWEEMQIISDKAFQLQDKIMSELDKIEMTETDITQIQAACATRESIWNLMGQITARELELKEKTFHKETPAEREERHRVVREEMQHHCCCGHHHTEEEQKCCRKSKKNCCKGKKQCKKK